MDRGSYQPDKIIMIRFEYRMISSLMDPDTPVEICNCMGRDGWELVAIHHGQLYFKREILPADH